ncbi:hypothetical protein [Campylobacter geochelonis]|uniref:Putative 5-methylcytosine-specific restriction enzyme B n=1 Tax=Campylobacter geochelonis TaxID=1780362 RepID=A0A128ENT4_9BACT|nr:hypothetical protein [Campylobacter geochelonis]QKF70435.1 putative type IV methyl-directed restriction system, component McrB [Campylobacter geochelonis]CZE46300.1 putative 5-methylcytosine-specific restriction enzyme B [Campylobacter geochelonis]CZE50678.1 putative 5-methylcytosine-specific restriction enzyme B [Campylobacter geochelonis]
MSTNSSYVDSLLDLYKEKFSDRSLTNKVLAISSALDVLSKVSQSFSQKEGEFLQNLYINFSNESPNDIKILDFSLNFTHPEYFFIPRFLETNINYFYNDFALKDRIIAHQNTFTGKKNQAISEFLSGSDKDIVALYIFIENIAKNYGDFCEDKELKHAFKTKIVKFYDALYKLFEASSQNLVKEYFNLTLLNQPMLLVEFVKSCLLSDNILSVVALFKDETRLNLHLEDGYFMSLSDNLLLEFISVVAVYNPNLTICFYNQSSVSILSTIDSGEIRNLEDFSQKSAKFITEFKPYPNASDENSIKCIYASLFFEYVLKYKNNNLSLNTLYMGGVGSGKYNKIREILHIKNVPEYRYRFITLHPGYDYSDIMDGFVNGVFVDGAFKQMCKRAILDSQNEYFIILHNIANCDINSVFGESFQLLLDRYSSTNKGAFVQSKNSPAITAFDENKKEKYSVLLKDGVSCFAIPSNLYIIATYDSNLGFDENWALFSRFFTCIKLDCDYTKIEASLEGVKNAHGFVKICKKLNEFIQNDVLNDSNIEIGHYVFLKIKEQITNDEISDKVLKEFFDIELSSILSSIFAKFLTYQESRKAVNSAKILFKLS